MISQEQAEEIAARYRVMGARDCTAEMVMSFFSHSMCAQESKLREICEKFKLTGAKVVNEWDEGIAP